MKEVTLRYWLQDTMESGRWIELNMSKKDADIIINSRIYDRAYILEDDEKAGKQQLEDKERSE